MTRLEKYDLVQMEIWRKQNEIEQLKKDIKLLESGIEKDLGIKWIDRGPGFSGWCHDDLHVDGWYLYFNTPGLLLDALDKRFPANLTS